MAQTKNEKSKFISLEDVLGQNTDDLTALKTDDFDTEKLGTVPVTAVSNPEYKEIKKQCMKMVPTGDGGMQPDLDDDKLMLLIVLKGIDKDKRSDFTFYDKQLLKKLDVVSGEEAAEKLLSPGEIYSGAMTIQNISGFGKKAQKDREDEVKNS